MKKALIVLLSILMLNGKIQAQTIARKVIASAGASYEGASLQVGYTVGETVITTVSSGGIMLTQGFQQPEPCDADFRLNNGSDTIITCLSTYILHAPEGYSSYLWNDTSSADSISITSSGWYTCQVTKGPCTGIDSVFVRFNQPSSSQQSATACNSYTWNGSTYLISGIYTYTTTNAVGCDSITTLNLTILLSTNSITTVSACGSYTWNGNTYTGSGNYSYSTTNANGCDSLAVLQLTINQPTYNSETQYACNSYTWNGTTYTTSGTYVHTYTNNGCASADTLHLTISDLAITINATPILCKAGTSTVSVLANGGIAPFTGTGTFIVSAGAYNYTVTDSKGCARTESITITEPTAISVVTSSTPAYRGADGTATAIAYGGTAPYHYSWNTTPIQTTATATSLSAGTYSVTVTDANGCTQQSSVTVQSSGTVDCPTAFKTYGQGAWGAPANGNNAGAYLNAHFAAAYPNGLRIGDCGRYIILTSSTAVRNFLPSGSTPRQLNAGTLTNPTRQSYSNVFAGHLVTLNLNMTFDSADANFGNSATLLKNAIIKTGMFTGWSVQQLYNEANRVIGCGGSTSYINALKDAVEMINGSWEGGQKSNDYLNCPASSNLNAGQPITDIKDIIKDNVSAYPNPTRDNTRIKYTMSGAGSVAITIYNVQGSVVGTYSSKHSSAGEYYMELPMKRRGLSAGVYTMQINRNGKVDRVRVVVQ